MVLEALPQEFVRFRFMFLYALQKGTTENTSLL